MPRVRNIVSYKSPCPHVAVVVVLVCPHFPSLRCIIFYFPLDVLILQFYDDMFPVLYIIVFSTMVRMPPPIAFGLGYWSIMWVVRILNQFIYYNAALF